MLVLVQFQMSHIRKIVYLLLIYCNKTFSTIATGDFNVIPFTFQVPLYSSHRTLVSWVMPLVVALAWRSIRAAASSTTSLSNQIWTMCLICIYVYVCVYIYIYIYIYICCRSLVVNSLSREWTRQEANRRQIWNQSLVVQEANRQHVSNPTTSLSNNTHMVCNEMYVCNIDNYGSIISLLVLLLSKVVLVMCIISSMNMITVVIISSVVIITHCIVNYCL